MYRHSAWRRRREVGSLTIRGARRLRSLCRLRLSSLSHRNERKTELHQDEGSQHFDHLIGRNIRIELPIGSSNFSNLGIVLPVDRRPCLIEGVDVLRVARLDFLVTLHHLGDDSPQLSKRLRLHKDDSFGEEARYFASDVGLECLQFLWAHREHTRSEMVHCSVVVLDYPAS